MFLTVIFTIFTQAILQILLCVECLEAMYIVKTLSSPQLTSLGNWGHMKNCAEGTYVKGMQLKIEPLQNHDDDNTAINGIRFVCEKISKDKTNSSIILSSIIHQKLNSSFAPENSGPIYDDEKIRSLNSDNVTSRNRIESFTGPWGNWGKETYCSENRFAIGFQMNSQAPHQSPNGDKSGATNFRLLCSGYGNIMEVIEGDGMDWGTWTKKQMCEKHEILCGIQTHVYVSIEDPNLKNCWHRESNRTVDQLSLTNVNADCCHIPNPGDECTPTELWKLLVNCDNINSEFDKTCVYNKTTGLQFVSDFEESSVKTYEYLGYSMHAIAEALSSNFENHFEHEYLNTESHLRKSVHSFWKKENNDKSIWTSEKKDVLLMDVPPGYKIKIYQLIGTCGSYTIRTAKFHRIYTRADEFGNKIASEDFSNTTMPHSDSTEFIRILNQSISMNLNDDEPDVNVSTLFVAYLILGIVIGPIFGVILLNFVQKFCNQRYTEEELVAEAQRRQSTVSMTGRAAVDRARESLVFKNRVASMEMVERF